MEDYNYSDKPTRNEGYFKNLQLRIKTEKILNRLGGEFQQKKWINKCNFKKNTGYKPIYSCHGYGGKCGSCKNSWDDPYYKSEENKRTVRDDFKEWKISSSANNNY